MVQTNFKSQSGRSMVEMLGVLAIIGVLSVGGIAGYSVAMRKYRANVLLNQASIIAADIAGQIAGGSTDFDLSGYTENQGFGSVQEVRGEDALDDYQEGDDQFTLVMEDVDEEICALMQQQLGTRSTIRKVECYVDGSGTQIAALTFNKDLSNEDKIQDEDESEEGDDNISLCPTGTSEDGEGGFAIKVENTDCYCEEADTVYKDDSCTEKTDECFSYRDCNRGEYCHLTGDSGCDELKDQEPGRCIPLSECEDVVNYGDYWFAYCIDYGKYSEGASSDWWTAKDVCEAQGMRMARLSDFNCEPIVEEGYWPYCDPDKLSTELWLSVGENIYNESVWFDDKDESQAGCYYFYSYLDEYMELYSARRGSYRNAILCHK